MPLGWNISVHRQENGGQAPAPFGAPQGQRLAVWQTGLGGLRWLEALVSQGLAIDLGGNGYPSEYTVEAADVIPLLRGKPPEARERWVSDAHDVLGADWLGRTTTFQEAIAACSTDEWLIVRAWDES